MDETRLPIAKACQVVGGQADMARALGVTPAAVNQWCKGLRAVPAERCPAVERETRRVAAEKGDPALVVACEALRPDVEWGVLRSQIAPAAAHPNQRPVGRPFSEKDLDLQIASKVG